MKRLFLVLLMSLSLGLLMGCEESSIDFDQAYEAFDIIYQENDDESHVTHHVTLLTRVEDIRITWETSEPGVIDQFGNVVRLDDDVLVTLTATLTKNEEIKTKSFDVTVKGLFEFFDVVIHLGDEKTELRLKSGDTFTLPEVEEVEGYAFVGWFKDANKNEPYEHGPVTEDLTLYTKYEVITISSYTVNYYFENIEDDAYTLDEAFSFTVQGNVGQRVFTAIELFGFTLQENLSDLTGYVTATPQTFNVYFDRDTFLIRMESDGVMLYEAYQKFQSTMIEITPEPKEGYRFLGWSTSTQGTVYFDFDNEVESNIHLYARWEEIIDDPYTYEGYYDGIDGMQGETLKQALRNLITANYLSIGYSSTSYILEDADEALNKRGYLYLIYNGDTSVVNVWNSGNSWNKEHVWPQSKLGSASASDIHNLRASNPSINSSRGNLAFAQGSGTYKSVSGGWYPGDDHKGDVARIVLYMNTRWGIAIDSGIGSLEMFKTWHAEDPVSDFERQRNQIIFENQRNRNPYIDHPELVGKVYGPIQTSQGTYDFIHVHVEMKPNQYVDSYMMIEKRYVM